MAYPSNGINIFAGIDPVPVKFGPKGTDSNRKDARFTFHLRRAVQSAIADFLVLFGPNRRNMVTGKVTLAIDLRISIASELCTDWWKCVRLRDNFTYSSRYLL